MSSSFPNGFSSQGEENTSNLRGPFPVNSSFRNNEPSVVRSMFTTSTQTNPRGLFSSFPSVNHHQNSHASSSSFGFNNPPQMNNNMVSNVVDYFPVNNNPYLSRVNVTQTITNRYSAIVPTCLISSQIEYERARNPSILTPNSFYPPNFAAQQRDIFTPTTPLSFAAQQREILNPTPLSFADSQREISTSTPLSFADNQQEVLNPTPLNTFHPHQTYGDRFSFSPNHFPVQHVPNPQPAKKRSKPTKNSVEEDGAYDGRTHSLPYTKYGPYTCPKCETVFDTSQKFAAHVAAVHYKDESVEERAKRRMAKNKKKSCKPNQMLNGESQGIQTDGAEEETGGNNTTENGAEEETGGNNNTSSVIENGAEEETGGNNNTSTVIENGAEEETGGNNNTSTVIEAPNQLIVKEEPSYDLSN